MGSFTFPGSRRLPGNMSLWVCAGGAGAPAEITEKLIVVSYRHGVDMDTVTDRYPDINVYCDGEASCVLSGDKWHTHVKLVLIMLSSLGCAYHGSSTKRFQVLRTRLME